MFHVLVPTAYERCVIKGVIFYAVKTHELTITWKHEKESCEKIDRAFTSCKSSFEHGILTPALYRKPKSMASWLMQESLHDAASRYSNAVYIKINIYFPFGEYTVLIVWRDLVNT